MPRLHDRVKDTTISTGTGNIILSNTAPVGFQTFGNVYTTNDLFTYCIAGGGQWETGFGFLANSVTLIRAGVKESSNVNSLVNFSVGSKDVFVTPIAHSLMNTSIGSQYARQRGMDLP